MTTRVVGMEVVYRSEDSGLHRERLEIAWEARTGPPRVEGLGVG